MLEGGLFAACVVLALWWQGGHRHFARE